MSVAQDRVEDAGLGLAEISVLREVFEAFDEDGGGSIDTDELGTAMKALGADSTRAELEVRARFLPLLLRVQQSANTGASEGN